MAWMLPAAAALPFAATATWSDQADLNSRAASQNKPALVVNIDVKDTHAEAAVAAPQALKLCQMVRVADHGLPRPIFCLFSTTSTAMIQIKLHTLSSQRCRTCEPLL